MSIARRELVIEEHPAPTWPHDLQVRVSHRLLTSGDRPQFLHLKTTEYPDWPSALQSLHA